MAQLRKVDWKKIPIPRLPEGRRAAPLRPRCVFPPCLIVHRAPESVSCWRCGCRARASCPEWKELAGEENALERFEKDPDVPDWCCPLCAYAVSTGEELEGELAEMKEAEEQVSEAAAANAETFEVPFQPKATSPAVVPPPSQTGPPPPGAQAPPPSTGWSGSALCPYRAGWRASYSHGHRVLCEHPHRMEHHASNEHGHRAREHFPTSLSHRACRCSAWCSILGPGHDEPEP